MFKKGRLFIGNALQARQLLRVRNPSTGLLQTWDGGTVTCRISATPTGGAIAGLGPFTMAVDTGGAYSYTIPSSAIDALDSATYHGALVYLIVEGGAGGEYRGIRPLEVVAARYVS